MNQAPTPQESAALAREREAIYREQSNMITVKAKNEETGEEFSGSLTQVIKDQETPKPPIMEPRNGMYYVEDFFPPNKKRDLMLGKLDASPYVQAAINASWGWNMNQYQAWEPGAESNPPPFKGDPEAWARSSASISYPVVLPPCRLWIVRDINLPQCVPLLGAGGGSVFTGSELFFFGDAAVNVLGNLESKHGPFQMLRGTIAGIKFIPDAWSPIVLHGSLSNFKISNCHFSSVNFREGRMIHVADEGGGSEFGNVYAGQTLKEVTIEDCQIEGGRAGVTLVNGRNLNIHNNTIMYTPLGLEIRNCDTVRITSNNILGTKPRDAIQVAKQAGIIAGGTEIMAVGNQLTDLDLGAAVNGKSNHFYLNDWSNTPEGKTGREANIDPSWTSPEDFGPIKKGDKAPYAGE